MHLNSQLAFQRYALPYFTDGARVLEIGPDGDPSIYRRELGDLQLDWQTADLSPHVPPTHLMPDEYTIPLADGAFDVVLAGQVIEHVPEVWTWTRELSRVAAVGGHIILISPISWPYHEAPVDCWRIYPDGMRALCAYAGLAVEVCEQVDLEPSRSRHTYFGESWEYQRDRHRETAIGGAVKTVIGWPMPRALDLVTVATKR